MKYITQTEFDVLKIQNIADKKYEIETALTFVDQVSAFYPSHLIYDVSDNNGKIFLEHVYTALKHESLTIIISYNEYQKKYSIFCRDLYSLKNLDHNTITDKTRRFIQPNKIGVLSHTKILQWINYWEACYALCSQINSEKTNQIDTFLKSLEGLPVQWNQKKTGGRIKKGGLDFIFNISDGYISQKIEIHYETPSTLESFIKLSENKF